jgi:hypothetical protein
MSFLSVDEHSRSPIRLKRRFLRQQGHIHVGPSTQNSNPPSTWSSIHRAHLNTQHVPLIDQAVSETLSHHNIPHAPTSIQHSPALPSIFTVRTPNRIWTHRAPFLKEHAKRPETSWNTCSSPSKQPHPGELKHASTGPSPSSLEGSLQHSM